MHRLSRHMNIALVVFFQVALLIFGNSAFSQSIKIVTEQFPPYNYEENGEIKGVSTEIVRAVLNDLHLEADIRIYPWARSYMIAQKEPNVLIYTIGRKPEREALFKWIGEIAPAGSYLFSFHSRFIVIHNLEEAKQYKVGTVREDIRDQYLKDNGFKTDINLHAAGSYEQTFQMLRLGRIDLWAIPELVAYSTVKKLGYPSNIIKKSYFLEEVSKIKYYMAFSNGTPDALVDQFKASLNKLKANGTISEIHKHHFDN